MTVITLVQGDTAPTINGTIKDSTGAVVDLTGCSVYLQMRKQDDRNYTINAACVVSDPINGGVTYTLAANDLNTPGDYFVQYEVHYPDTRIQTTALLVPVTVRRQ